jgi:hypothetical protein
MKKYILLLLLSVWPAVSYGQQPDAPIAIVERILNNYVDAVESTDSETNKQSMQNALVSLNGQCGRTDFPVLIDAWMYYDPTDFPARALIEPIFFKNKSDSLIEIGTRLKNKREWENIENAPYSELIDLRLKLSE